MATSDEIVSNATRAAEALTRLDQQQTDRIVEAAYRAGFDARVRLAKLAFEETRLGVWQDKVVKNVIATQLVYEDIRHEPTVGVISHDRYRGIIELAQPIGPIFALIPFNNPTSTALFKILIALKTRNPLVVSPHPAAKHSTAEAVRVCYEAALDAGAPEHCLQCVPKASPKKVQELMTHRHMALIIATGTGGLVRSAYSSGTPTIGIGPGNVPAYIGQTADVPFAVDCIMRSKTFDNGSICASEQSVVAKTMNADAVIAEFEAHGAYFMTPDEADKVAAVAFDSVRGTMTAAVVGQSAETIAARAGVAIPPGTRVLMARLHGVGREHPLSAEILAPILGFYVERDFEAAIERCGEITNYGGRGHTASIFSNDTKMIEYFSEKVAASRLLVNMPSTQGALGGMYNTLHPSYTLTCGSGANNSTTDNITARHLLNVHRISRRRVNERWMGLDEARLLDESFTADDVKRAYNRNH
jgi:acetaldehyde dehydrogenase/alcohol dehydrogenase